MQSSANALYTDSGQHLRPLRIIIPDLGLNMKGSTSSYRYSGDFVHRAHLANWISVVRTLLEAKADVNEAQCDRMG